jgi:serine/threonine protein kinase
VFVPGTRIGPYEVLSLVGAGGVGEVYRARDSRLACEVAIKVLPAAFAADGVRLRLLTTERGSGRSDREQRVWS